MPKKAIAAASSDECCDDAARHVRTAIARQPVLEMSTGVFAGGGAWGAFIGAW
jgi:hypothetical protein